MDSEKAGSDNITCIIMREMDQASFDYNIQNMADHLFEVEHTPWLMGYIHISVYCEDMEIPGQMKYARREVSLIVLIVLLGEDHGRSLDVAIRVRLDKNVK